MQQYHVVCIAEKHKWILKANAEDMWIRSSPFKWLAIRKAVKYCRAKKPCMMVIHTKDGHQEEVRHYHKKNFISKKKALV